MSQLGKKIQKIKFNKLGESTSSGPGAGVGDSARTIMGNMTNNIAAGTFRGLIGSLAAARGRAGAWVAGMLMMAMLGVVAGVQDTYATASSLSVSVTDGANPSVNIPPTTEGKFVASGATTFTVTTTHAAGYTVTAKSTALKDSTNTISTLTLPSGTSGITADDYDDNDYASTNNLNNTWGYLPSNLCTTSGTTTTCAANTLYLPAPISATQTLDEVSSATNNTYDINIGTRVTTDTAQGAYATTFTVAVVGNATPYSITYNKNTTDTVTGMPANHTTSDEGASGETVTLATNEPSREGYEFKGWCNVVVADGAACTGTSYAAGGTWTLNQTSATNSLTLYAVWKSSASSLYDVVAAMSKGKQTAADLKTTITVPTSADRTADTSNSGVYEYDASVFGTSSDASNDNKIYYYRGVLENSVGSYGSDGSAVTYPNYVILQAGSSKATTDTCWRIVRTTGSGGVKMIYNGKWTGSTCANATTNAQVTTQAFNTAANGGGSAKSIVKVGYTFNSSYTTTTASTAYSTLFGSNTSFSGNSTNSTIKTYIEDTWFTNINSWANKLEASAGYCNDRTLNTGSNWTTPATDSTSISTPYTTASSGITVYYFGAYVRTWNAAQKPTLTCSRGTADLYTTSSASNGNKQLSKPVALLTADESNLAGSGPSGSSGSGVYHANSFLRSGSVFWLLSPGSRASSGDAREFYLYSDGNLHSNSVSNTYGVRPSISLASGTSATGGSGTATDPWVVTP